MRGGPDQQQRVVGTVAHHDVLFADRQAHLSIDGQVHAFIRSVRGDANYAGLGHQDRAIGQHVRTDRRS